MSRPRVILAVAAVLIAWGVIVLGYTDDHPLRRAVAWLLIGAPIGYVAGRAIEAWNEMWDV